jgi:hypothetical protein
MKNYKINRTDPKETPSSETIAKYKNFAQLSHEYDRLVKRPKVPIYKDKRTFIVLLIIALAAYIIAEFDDRRNDEDQKTKQQDTTQVLPNP